MSAVESVPIIEFQAREGKTNDGFDPPLNEPQDKYEQTTWHTSVGKSSPHDVNDLLKMVFPSVEMAAEYELFIPEASQLDVDVAPKTFTAIQTDITITGKNHTTGPFAAEIQIRKKSDGSVYGKLIVDMMPWREIAVNLYKLEPSHVFNRGKVVAALPTQDAIQAELNARFKPACISFNLTAPITNLEFDYDTDPVDGIFETRKLEKTNGGGIVVNKVEKNNILTGIADQFGGPINVVFVHLLGKISFNKYGDPITESGLLGVNLDEDEALKRLAFISTDYPSFQPSDQEDPDGVVKSILRVIAHEVGHTLGLSTRTYIPNPKSVVPSPEAHDAGAVPKGTKALMRSGLIGAPGKWMRFEDWRQANLRAGTLPP